MGGKALKHLSVKRILESEYNERILKLTSHILNVISSTNSSVKEDFNFPAELSSKKTFGDIDVILYVETPDEFIEKMSTELNTKGYKTNGKCISMEWDNIQVDFNFAASMEELNWMKRWYSNGELSAITGRLYRFYRFKFANDGLYFIVKRDNIVDEIFLTRDYNKSLSLLDLNYDLLKQYTYNEMLHLPLKSKYMVDFSKIRLERRTPTQVEFQELAIQFMSDKKEKYPKWYGWVLLFKFSKVKFFIAAYKRIICELRMINRPIKRFKKKWTYTINKEILKFLGYF